MALLDNMYAPYSHLMHKFAEDPSITRLDLNSSNESSPPNPRLNYGGVVSLKLEQNSQPNFRPYDNSQNNINEDNRNKDLKVIHFLSLFSAFLHFYDLKRRDCLSLTRPFFRE